MCWAGNPHQQNTYAKKTIDLLVPNHGSTKSKLLNWFEFPCAALSLIALRFAIRQFVRYSCLPMVIAALRTPPSAMRMGISGSASFHSRIARGLIQCWVGYTERDFFHVNEGSSKLAAL
jgi:hypothetical protein